MQVEDADPYRIRLVVQWTNDSFKARWIEPEGQESHTFLLSLPLDRTAKAALRWYLEKYVGFVGVGDRGNGDALLAPDGATTSRLVARMNERIFSAGSVSRLTL